MPDQDSREYHLSRQQECEAMARQAKSHTARLAHRALAQEHARRATAGVRFEREDA